MPFCSGATWRENELALEKTNLCALAKKISLHFWTRLTILTSPPLDPKEMLPKSTVLGRGRVSNCNWTVEHRWDNQKFYKDTRSLPATLGNVQSQNTPFILLDFPETFWKFHNFVEQPNFVVKTRFVYGNASIFKRE